MIEVILMNGPDPVPPHRKGPSGPGGPVGGGGGGGFETEKPTKPQPKK